MKIPAKLLLVCAYSALCAVTALADGEPKAAKTLTISNADSLVPVRIPGYELRVLDIKKNLVVEIDAERNGIVPLPIYIYFPTKKVGATAESRELRLLYNDLARAQARIQDGDLAELLLRLDRVIRDYSEDNSVTEATPPPGEAAPSGRASRVVYEKVLSTSPDSEPTKAQPAAADTAGLPINSNPAGSNMQVGAGSTVLTAQPVASKG